MSRIIGTLSGGATLASVLYVPEIVQTNPFQGEYTYTPTAQQQTIAIEGLRALHDITINPIPQNYGLITWNGAFLTIS